MLTLGALLVGSANGQAIGSYTAETHPTLTTQNCKKGSGCSTEQNSVVIDSNWRWTHKTGDYTNCYTGNTWDASLCPDPATCTKNCALEGADYEGTYGIRASGNSLALKFVTNGPYSTNIGSRTYLLDSTGSKYKMFHFKNREFTFTADVSQLPCGLNGALYMVEMDADGGVSKFPTNKAGAKYGTGYCDAQCPHDLKWINGEANCKDWKPSPVDKNSGVGFYGTCCSEMDIWEANSMATAYTPHPCRTRGQTRCSGTECGDTDQGHRYDGLCDKDGCDFNSWRLGNRSFIGKGSSFAIDTSKPFTVVTQWLTADGTDNGDVSEIRRVYIQGGRRVNNSFVNVQGIPKVNSITDSMCTAQKSTFGDKNDFSNKGGLKVLGDAANSDRGMVLVMSLWDDHDVHMLWLDSDYPTTVPSTNPGVSRGPCSTDSGKPEDVESQSPNAQVIYSDIRFGEIGSTF